MGLGPEVPSIPRVLHGLESNPGTNGLLSCEQLERQAEFNSSTQDEA